MDAIFTLIRPYIFPRVTVVGVFTRLVAVAATIKARAVMHIFTRVTGVDIGRAVAALVGVRHHVARLVHVPDVDVLVFAREVGDIAATVAHRAVAARVPFGTILAVSVRGLVSTGSDRGNLQDEELHR